MKGLQVLLFVLLAVLVVEGKYTVAAKRLETKPVIDSQVAGASVFTYNYNAAYLPVTFNHKEYDALMVRCQNRSNGVIGPSELSLSINLHQSEHSYGFEFTPITHNSIKFKSKEPWENYGTEDPRIIYRPSDKQYYMLYTAVETTKSSHGNLIARLSLATTTDPFNADAWVRHGPLFKDTDGWQWSKSGAMVLRDGFSGPQYLIYGDSSLMPGVQLATSHNLLNWTTLDGIYIHTRSDNFDSHLVESGPPPLLLSDGNYLFVYNSAKKDPNSGNGLQYNAGWVIIDGKDPTKILERCTEPLLSPVLPWEIGTKPFLDLTPNVVFVEGMRKGISENTFVIYYGAADSVIGVAEVVVKIS
eukprot:TRINITY_DN10178_c0_g1_i1.p1 TRINITY_DN10178_c0_g1~~TRINITY_DN10178_c0_g1_i1.p1  ORF type:complete len:358 (+),score=75.09 TRINITY_DN10178_c0_g1_i1:60-1133(+)